MKVVGLVCESRRELGKAEREDDELVNTFFCRAVCF